MSNIPVFGSKELEKALKILGFEIDDSRGKGGHKLAEHPTKKPHSGQASFVTIRGLKEYSDPNFRKAVINEIKKFDFTEEEILLALRGKKSKK